MTVAGAVADSDSNCINRTVDVAMQHLKVELDPKKVPSGDKILVRVSGWSRGGVAANLFSTKLAETKSEYSGLDITISTVVFDPVPGGTSGSVTAAVRRPGLDEVDLKDINQSVMLHAIKTAFAKKGEIASRGFFPQLAINAKV